MSDVIEGVAKSALEFYVFSDGEGINEIRMSDDVQFVMSCYLGVGQFISDSLISNDGKNIPLSQFFLDLAEIARKMEAAKDAAESGQMELEV